MGGIASSIGSGLASLVGFPPGSSGGAANTGGTAGGFTGTGAQNTLGNAMSLINGAGLSFLGAPGLGVPLMTKGVAGVTGGGGLGEAVSDVAPLAGVGLDMAGQGRGQPAQQPQQMQRSAPPSFPLAQVSQPMAGKIKPAGVGRTISTLSPNAFQNYAGMLLGGQNG